jgi:P-type Cu2+ transporter
VRVGGPRLLEEAGLAALPEAGAWRDEGAIILHVLLEKDGAGPTVAGALALADEVREESRQAVDALHKLGIQVVMITGDAQAVAESSPASWASTGCSPGCGPRTRPPRWRSCTPRG